MRVNGIPGCTCHNRVGFSYMNLYLWLSQGLSYLIFNVAMANATQRIVTIQNLVTILLS